MSEENFLEIRDKASEIPEGLFKAYSKKQDTGKTAPVYDDSVRNFAISLHMKSARAYRYVRRIFKNALPSESTLRR